MTDWETLPVTAGGCSASLWTKSWIPGAWLEHFLLVFYTFHPLLFRHSVEIVLPQPILKLDPINNILRNLVDFWLEAEGLAVLLSKLLFPVGARR